MVEHPEGGLATVVRATLTELARTKLLLAGVGHAGPAQLTHRGASQERDVHGKRKELCTSLSKGRLYKCCLLPVCDRISVAVSHLGLYYKQEVNNEVLKDMCISVFIRTGMEGWLKELFFSSSTNLDT